MPHALHSYCWPVSNPMWVYIHAEAGATSSVGHKIGLVGLVLNACSAFHFGMRVAPVSVLMILPSCKMWTAITASVVPSGKSMTECSTRTSSFS